MEQMTIVDARKGCGYYLLRGMIVCGVLGILFFAACTALSLYAGTLTPDVEEVE